MKIVVFFLAAVGLAFLAQWFGLGALIFGLGHLWFETLVYGALTLGASALSAIYGALFALECLKNRSESASKE